MTDVTAAKAWTVSVDIGLGVPAKFAAEGGEAIDLANVPPVMQLLASVGSCFGQSCIGLMQFHGWPSTGMRLVVNGHKPAGSLIGKGLDSLKISVLFDAGLTAEQQTRLLADAKKICTVTNSLSSKIEMLVERLGQDSAA